VATPDAVRRLKAAGDTRTDLYAQLIAEHGAEVPAAWLDAQLAALQGGADGRKASGFKKVPARCAPTHGPESGA
jgi:hypothetical protein